MMHFVEPLLDQIRGIVEFMGVWGVGIGMMFESACIPLPSELILPVAGMMADSGTITMFGANLAACVGSLIGSLGAYTVGYFGGRQFILEHGNKFFISQSHFHKAEKTFNKYGSAAVFFGRLLPVIRTFISLPAGISRMNIKKFVIYSTIGMIPWNFVLIYLGFKFNQQYETLISPIFHRFEYVVAGLILLIALVISAKFLLSKRKRTTA